MFKNIFSGMRHSLHMLVNGCPAPTAAIRNEQLKRVMFVAEYPRNGCCFSNYVA